MPRQTSDAEFEAVVEVAARLPDGGSMADLVSALEIGIARRTVQRRLAALVAEGRSVRDGRGPGTRNRIPNGDAEPPVHPAEERVPAAAEEDVPFATERVRLSGRLDVVSVGAG